MSEPNRYDVVIVGGGPGGLSAALALGRARRRVLLCDAGPRRNAAAVHLNNFVTRDGTPPDEFRRIGREQLTRYPSVEVREVGVASIGGQRGAFRVELTGSAGAVEARRVLLCTGMIDERLPIDGFAELWGHAIFQCPYCHGWEIQDRRWGVLVTAASLGHIHLFALQARAWTSDVVVFTGGLVLPDDVEGQLTAAGVAVETAPVVRLIARADAPRSLEAIELAGGRRVLRDALFAHPPQRQVELVGALGLQLEEGLVRVDPMKRETSVPGIFAAGDLATRMQGAILAAAAGAQAAAMINLEVMMERATSGAFSSELPPATEEPSREVHSSMRAQGTLSQGRSE